MRELKFRIWSNKDGQFVIENDFYDGSGLTLDGKFSVCSQSFFGNTENSDNYIIEQYTGLKDKNGLEIYEGDILIYRPSYQESLGGQLPNHVFTASFDDGAFVYGNERMRQEDTNDFEIIGNIHENPSLLK